MSSYKRVTSQRIPPTTLQSRHKEVEMGMLWASSTDIDKENKDKYPGSDEMTTEGSGRAMTSDQKMSV